MVPKIPSPEIIYQEKECTYLIHAEATVRGNFTESILAAKVFNESDHDGTAIGIPEGLEEDALELCDELFDTRRPSPFSKVIVPSIFGYQCDILKHCQREQQQLLGGEEVNLCPCFPMELGKVTCVCVVRVRVRVRVRVCFMVHSKRQQAQSINISKHPSKPNSINLNTTIHTLI